MTLEKINQREDKENASFLKWIKSPSFQLQSDSSRTNDLELYMISKNREIGDLQSEIEVLHKHLFDVVNDCIMLDSECSKFESVTKANEYLSAQKGTE